MHDLGGSKIDGDTKFANVAHVWVTAVHNLRVGRIRKERVGGCAVSRSAI
jgi:hypothetical protein